MSTTRRKHGGISAVRRFPTECGPHGITMAGTGSFSVSNQEEEEEEDEEEEYEQKWTRSASVPAIRTSPFGRGSEHSATRWKNHGIFTVRSFPNECGPCRSTSDSISNFSESEEDEEEEENEEVEDEEEKPERKWRRSTLVFAFRTFPVGCGCSVAVQENGRDNKTEYGK